MKKIIYTLCIVFINYLFFPDKLSSQIEYKIDSVQKFNWDNALEWQLNIRDHYSYANGGNDYTNLHSIKKDSITSNWENSFQQIRIFNSDNNLDMEIFQFWGEGQWLDNSKTVYSYNNNQNNDKIIYYRFNNNDWSLKGRNLMTYNSNNLIIESISQDWNLNTSEFDNISRSTNIYENNLISESMLQIWNKDELIFENVNKSINTYEGNQIKQQESYTWNDGNWNTTPNSCANYTYFGPLIKTLKIQVDDGNGLKNQSLTIYNYFNDNPVEIIQQMWKDTGDGSFNWVNSNLQTFSYDINNQVSMQISSIWGPTSIWILHQKSIYFTSGTLGIKSKNLNMDKVYPNPFSNDLNISLKVPLANDSILQIFDVNGKQVSKIELRKGTQLIKFNNNYLSKGLYFIKLSNGTNYDIIKVIKN